MGIPHLKQIQELMSARPERCFTRSELRDILGTDYNVVLEALDYLTSEGLVLYKQEGNVIRYWWNKEVKV